MTLYYRCPCGWIEEGGDVCDEDGNPARCRRCHRTSWDPIPTEQFLAELDSHDIVYCEACKRFEPR